MPNHRRLMPGARIALGFDTGKGEPQAREPPKWVIVKEPPCAGGLPALGAHESSFELVVGPSAGISHAHDVALVLRLVAARAPERGALDWYVPCQHADCLTAASTVARFDTTVRDPAGVDLGDVKDLDWTGRTYLGVASWA
jgi:hypothetical protein